MTDKKNFSQFIDQVKTSSDIVSVVSRYVTLNKKGKNWWGNCPFHYEKTPSFCVNEAEQIYHCFGCGAGGDIIRFVEKIESCGFYDALKILAGYAGLQMPEFNENDGNIAQEKKKKERLYQLLKDTANYYYANLKLPEAAPAIKYIEKRKLDNSVVKIFGIGYSLGWNEVITYLTKKGYSLNEIKEAGVADEKDGRAYDAFAKRLVFPLINSSGNVVGFSARLLEDANFAKYKNSGQTVLFDKSKCVFGIYNIKKMKQSEELNKVIIVEGQMDVISLYRSEIKNAVATLGTALTPYHCKEIKKYCNKVVLCFDGDGAGKKATLRSIEILVEAGLDVYIASMPAGTDPDDYIKQFGKEKLEIVINNAKHWVEFLITEYAKSFNLSKANEKAKFVTECLKVIKNLQTAAEQNIYLEMVKKFTNISLDVLRKDLEQSSIKEKKEAGQEVKQSQPAGNAYIKAVQFILASLMYKKNYATMSDIVLNSLTNGDYIKIYNYVKQCYENKKTPIVSALYDMFDVENNADIEAIANYVFKESEDTAEFYKDCLKTLKITELNKKQKELAEKMSQEKDLDKKRELAKQLHNITLELKKN